MSDLNIFHYGFLYLVRSCQNGDWLVCVDSFEMPFISLPRYWHNCVSALERLPVHWAKPWGHQSLLRLPITGLAFQGTGTSPNKSQGFLSAQCSAKNLFFFRWETFSLKIKRIRFTWAMYVMDKRWGKGLQVGLICITTDRDSNVVNQERYPHKHAQFNHETIFFHNIFKLALD